LHSGVGIVFGSFLAYDGIVNDFEVYGGIARFFRSFVIASQISCDYSYFFWKFKDVDENSDEYIAVSV
jgi:hypothetical protein